MRNLAGIALFAGDVSLDATMTVPHVPGPDEKVRMTSFAEAPGGVVSNAAVAAHLAGQPVMLLARIGNDIASQAVAPVFDGKGLALAIEETDGMLCRAMIVVDGAGEKRLLLHPGVSMYPSVEAVTAADLERVAWLHTAIYDTAAAAVLIARARKKRIPFSIDLEPVTFREGIEQLSDHIDGADIVFCNSRAALQLGADAVATLRRMGAQSVILTLGPQGATWHDAQGVHTADPPPTLPIVDTTGAGDCLAGWIVAERLRGTAPGTALRRAVTAASLSCGRLGAQASFPTRTDVAQLIGQA